MSDLIDKVISGEAINIQITPAKTRVIPNDKCTKVLFNLAKDEYADMVRNKKSGAFIEKRNHKKHGDIKTAYGVMNKKNFNSTEPLNQFDFAVFSVCISEYLAGNQYTTPAIINRGLSGKTSEGGNGKLNENQREAIMHSLQKLQGTLINLNLTEAFNKLGYAKSDKAFAHTGTVLPCEYISGSINGQDATLIHFTGIPMLLRVADIKSQILRYDQDLLDVPNQNNTPRIIAVKNYVMRRVAEIKAHKMTATITFDNIFERCGLKQAMRNSKMRVREAIIALFEQLLAKGEIKSFAVHKRGNTFYSVSFEYDPKKAAAESSFEEKAREVADVEEITERGEKVINAPDTRIGNRGTLHRKSRNVA